MKTIKKLKLNRLSISDLKKREMSSLRGGGGCCICGCRGTSSDWDNGHANIAGGYSPADGGIGQGGTL